IGAVRERALVGLRGRADPEPASGLERRLRRIDDVDPRGLEPALEPAAHERLPHVPEAYQQDSAIHPLLRFSRPGRRSHRTRRAYWLIYASSTPAAPRPSRLDNKRKHRMHRTILILAGLGLAHAALAEPRDYVFDMAHSRIFFDIDHRGYSTMLGRFAEFGGSFKYDAENPANSSLDITIDPSSVDMFHEGLNNHLKTADFFDVEQYP